MSISIYVPSACLSSGKLIDLEDAELNPDGVVCCSNCKEILAARNSWYKLYKYNPIKRSYYGNRKS